jgi:hypothetical protein
LNRTWYFELCTLKKRQTKYQVQILSVAETRRSACKIQLAQPSGPKVRATELFKKRTLIFVLWSLRRLTPVEVFNQGQRKIKEQSTKTKFQKIE